MVHQNGLRTLQLDFVNYMLYMLYIHMCWGYTCSHCKQHPHKYFCLHVESKLGERRRVAVTRGMNNLFYERHFVLVMLIINLPLLLCFFQWCTRDQSLCMHCSHSPFDCFDLTSCIRMLCRFRRDGVGKY